MEQKTLIAQKLNESPKGIELYFPKGFYGYEEEKILILKSNENEKPFLHLSNKNLHFVLIESHFFTNKSLMPIISDADLEKLKIKKLSECSIYYIVTIPQEQVAEMTANLQAPICINLEEKIAYQFISLKETSLLRMKILSNIEK